MQSIVRFLARGASKGENLVLVTRPSRRRKVIDWLKASLPDAAKLNEPGRFRMIDAQELAAAVSRDGVPAWPAFQPKAVQLLEEASQGWTRPVCYYGDAVNELWQSGQHAAAIELETLWNRFLHDRPEIDVFCGYLIDALRSDSYNPQLELLAREHGVMRPGPDELDLQCALDQASREILGKPMFAQAPVYSYDDWRERVPLSMRYVMWLLEHEKVRAERVLRRAREFFAVTPV